MPFYSSLLKIVNDRENPNNNQNTNIKKYFISLNTASNIRIIKANP